MEPQPARSEYKKGGRRSQPRQADLSIQQQQQHRHRQIMRCLCLEGLAVSSHLLIQIVHFYQRNPDTDVLATHNRGVSARWQVCIDRRLAWLRRSMPAALNIHDLVLGDNSADYRSLPVIVRGNQSTAAVVQFQLRISQYVLNAVLSQLWTNGAHDYPLRSAPLDDEPSDHHVIAIQNNAATANVE